MSQSIIIDNIIEEQTRENIYNNIYQNYNGLAIASINNLFDRDIGTQLIPTVEQYLPEIGTPSFTNVELIETRSQVHVRYQNMKKCLLCPELATHALIISITTLPEGDWPINLRENEGAFTPYVLTPKMGLLYNTDVDMMSLTIQTQNPTDTIVRLYLYYTIT